MPSERGREIEVFQSMIDNKINQLFLDPWVPNQASDFAKVRTVRGTIEYNGFTFFIQHTEGGGGGMGQYPPTATISILHKF